MQWPVYRSRTWRRMSETEPENSLVSPLDLAPPALQVLTVKEHCLALPLKVGKREWGEGGGCH